MLVKQYINLYDLYILINNNKNKYGRILFLFMFQEIIRIFVFYKIKDILLVYYNLEL